MATVVVVSTCEKGKQSFAAQGALSPSLVLMPHAVQVLATVFGPAPAAIGQSEPGRLPEVSCSLLVAPFCGGPRRFRSRNDGRSQQLQHVIETAVSQCLVPDVLGHSQISISVVVTDADGGVDSCAINAAILAVADAGAPPFLALNVVIFAASDTGAPPFHAIHAATLAEAHAGAPLSVPPMCRRPC